MTLARLLVASALPLLAIACAAPAPTPAPSPAPTPVASAPPPEIAVPTRTYENWLDAPVTPGDWTYANEPGESLALFGTAGSPVFIMRCDKATRRVGIARVGSAEGNVPVRIRTETAERVVTATPRGGARPLVFAEFDARDTILDAMAFSRGRFGIEAAGFGALYVPAWPEVSRIVEDCR